MFYKYMYHTNVIQYNNLQVIKIKCFLLFSWGDTDDSVLPKKKVTT